MTVSNPVQAYSQTQAQQAAEASKTPGAKKKLAEDLDAFLMMLTTQLQNQDPLSPMESNEFTQQLVGFSQVEQQIGINENLEQQISLQQSSMNSLALGFIGKYAEVQDNLVTLADGKVKFAYSLASDAASTKLDFYDDKGVLVRTMSGKTAQGNHVMTWDGRAQDGTQLPDGEYTVKLSSKNTKGEPVDSWTTVQARITGASTDGKEPYVTINGAALPLSQIGAVTEKPTL
ncbi:flagellar hook assembly protein FlgD [Caenispirillum salinarum]|uniref:flagellar hook assembly protein FlgD n=1 Tax=Caenispirillum salinarum TaxID=859058 RepID=UPI00384A6E0B